MSVELQDLDYKPSGARRLSFEEAVGQTDVDGPPQSSPRAGEIPEIRPYETTDSQEKGFSLSQKFRSFREYSDEMEIPEIFKSKILWIVVAVILVILVGIPLLLIVILVPLHFADLDYWEIGFSMQRSTGEVDTSKVYGPGGRHGLGVDYTFKAFDANSHYSVLNDLSVFTRDRLEVFLDVTFQYFIRPDELKPLHDAYDQQYHEIIISRVESVIKATAPRFNTTDYFLIRSTVEEELANQLREDLGGDGCCDAYCTGDLYGEYDIAGLVCDGCERECPEALQRFHVDIRYFQLLEVNIPTTVSQLYLNAIILLQNAEQEQFVQNAVIETLRIEEDVQDILNQATEVREEAAANAILIGARAVANATAIVEGARNSGLALIYERLGITNPRYKASLDYLRTLRRPTTNVRLHVGFDSTISGPYNEDN